MPLSFVNNINSTINVIDIICDKQCFEGTLFDETDDHIILHDLT